MLRKGLFRKPHNKLEADGLPDAPSPAVPDTLYVKCAGCRAMLVAEELSRSAMVCPRCGHHFRLPPRQRIELLCDPGTFVERDEALTSGNPIGFPEYEGKLAKAKAATGENEAVVTGVGRIDGYACGLIVMNSGFMMGSMGAVVGEKITRLLEYAAEAPALPVIACTASGGARMQEGIVSLMQMAKTSAAVKRHSDAGGLFIVLLTDPTTGGVTASFAMLGDITLSEPGALIAFAGPKVIEQTTRQRLPQGFQRAEFLLSHGFVDAIVPRGAQRETLARLLKLHQRSKEVRV